MAWQQSDRVTIECYISTCAQVFSFHQSILNNTRMWEAETSCVVSNIPPEGDLLHITSPQSLTHIVKQHFTVCLCQQSVVSGYCVHGANWRAEIKKHINQIPIQDKFFSCIVHSATPSQREVSCYKPQEIISNFIAPLPDLRDVYPHGHNSAFDSVSTSDSLLTIFDDSYVSQKLWII